MNQKLSFGKKGQMMTQFGNIAVALGGLAIVLVVSFLILAQGREIAVQDKAATSVYNESFTFNNNTKVGLAHECISISCDWIRNADSTQIMLMNSTWGTGNYTCGVDGDSGDYILFNWRNASAPISGSGYIAYSCLEPNLAWNSTRTMTEATANISGWMSIIVITLIGGIIISLAMMMKRNSE